MKSKYEKEAKSVKVIQAGSIQGLPADAVLNYPSIHVRFYPAAGHKDHFHATFAIPSVRDEDGYVKEQEFSLPIIDEENLDFSQNSAPLQDHSFDTLAKAVVCSFSEKTSMGQVYLTFHLEVRGTPFIGEVLIEKDLYTCPRH